MSKNNSFSATTASRYSLALYELANENNSIDEVEEQSISLLKLIDESKDFIDIIPNNKLNDLTYVENIIRKNRIISVENRNSIREYGLSTFSWDNLIVRYIQILSEL